ncbi:hypothetical protein [Cupriavidus pauculus]|uniref:hypothetical protein n=1 Tax=Cupriavidus pauculus TaxID=82633 RepID=UPI001EE35B6B|nr:hypothetical protein [Cupriavidus pauculus]GJG97378.1 hypothetical protein CBA19C6_22835 [Cupriavidus pauculus]
MRKVFAAIAAAACIVAFAAHGQGTSSTNPSINPSTPMIAPPPPRMLDPATSTVDDPGGTAATSQRDYCRQLLDKINALPSGPQWSQGQSSVTTADGRKYSTLEREPERKRLQEAYRQECAQARK